MMLITLLAIYFGIPIGIILALMERSRREAREMAERLDSDEYKRRVKNMAAAHLVSWGMFEAASELLKGDSQS